MWILLAVSRRRPLHRQWDRRAADHTLLTIHQQRLDRRGAEIEPEEQGCTLRESGSQRMPVKVRQSLTGLVEQMACGRIDREANLLVGAHRGRCLRSAPSSPDRPRR